MDELMTGSMIDGWRETNLALKTNKKKNKRHSWGLLINLASCDQY